MAARVEGRAPSVIVGKPLLENGKIIMTLNENAWSFDAQVPAGHHLAIKIRNDSGSLVCVSSDCDDPLILLKSIAQKETNPPIPRPRKRIDEGNLFPCVQEFYDFPAVMGLNEHALDGTNAFGQKSGELGECFPLQQSAKGRDQALAGHANRPS